MKNRPKRRRKTAAVRVRDSGGDVGAVIGLFRVPKWVNQYNRLVVKSVDSSGQSAEELLVEVECFKIWSSRLYEELSPMRNTEINLSTWIERESSHVKTEAPV